ncbi:hypothetical protein QQ008_20540 [Fulvivirgaceae bacterium BMA10]|uniref:Uncharacterized protein n=1 Tax=Splendidivirga corallicola TaxID=3051826 RepID=A0ABT8KSR9_9BACT|nr:hypothetical protein [Fulvivirgaceae bacterium BMA10]
MLTLQEQLKFCRTCQKRQLDPQRGIVCSLTNEKPTFTDNCPNYQIDSSEAQRLASVEQEAIAAEKESNDFFSPEKKGIKMGVVGGVIMMIIALVWFFLGWQAGYIYFYPPVLFVIGIYAFFRGIVKGNVSGQD